MKLLMFYAREFLAWPHEKVVPEVPDCHEGQACRDCVVTFYHAETEDIGRENKVISKWIKNAKWLAGKFNSRTVVLHSFNHLSESKSPLETALSMAKEVRARLEGSGYRVLETPFGYQNEWKIHVAGESLAKVFKTI